MSRLRIFTADLGQVQGNAPLSTTEDPDAMASALAKVGIRFERWESTEPGLEAGDHDAVIAAYRGDIDRITRERGYQSVDVVSLAAGHPARAVLRKQLLSEHTHCEDEVRFFVSGSGMFSMHVGERVYEVLCSQGDLIGIPDRTQHWFDMGEEPAFVAIRFFTSSVGLEADYTKSGIDDRFPRYESTSSGR